MDILTLVLEEISGRFGSDAIFRFVIMLEFAILAVVGVNGLLKSIVLDARVREHYNDRLDVFEAFYKVYQAEQQRIREEEEEEERNREKLRRLRDGEEI